VAVITIVIPWLIEKLIRWIVRRKETDSWAIVAADSRQSSGDDRILDGNRDGMAIVDMGVDEFR
jgi:hypothetical protein